MCIRDSLRVFQHSPNRQPVGELVKPVFIGFGLGRGTANSEILDYLGLGESEKMILLATAGPAEVQQILQSFREQMHFDKPGSGIAFTVPITSVGGMTTLKILSLIHICPHPVAP